MSKKFRAQFENLRQIIKTNVLTLKELIHQSDILENTINSLNSDDANKEIKKTLLEIRQKISESIKTLIDQTEKLFKTYDKLVDEVFCK